MSVLSSISIWLVESDWFFVLALLSLGLALMGLRSSSRNSKLHRSLTFLVLMIFPAMEVLGIYTLKMSLPAA